MRKTFLPFSPPLIGEEEIAEVVDTLRSDWITTGPKVKRFEQQFAQFIGAPAALAVNSCTDAMLVGLAAFGIEPGDVIITTPMTFCSTVHVIEHRGARPAFADISPETLTIDPEQVEKAIKICRKRRNRMGRVRALLPVHLYGHPCEMDALLAIARKHDLFVLEDAAHALPARYKGRMIGIPPFLSSSMSSPQYSPTHLTAFSFYATKNLTTAEGGMLTGEAALIEKARTWSLHGMSRDAYKRYSNEGSWYYEVVAPGYKCNMTDIQASLGLHQLEKLPVFQRRRREIVHQYNAAFANYGELQIPQERPEAEHAWHLYGLRLNLDRLTISRNQFIEELRARNIGSSVHFIPIHIHPYYRDKYGFEPQDYPVAYREYQRMLSLPLYPRLSRQDVDDVIEAVTSIVARTRR